MQFSGKFGVFTPPLEGSRPPLGKILDPPLFWENLISGGSKGVPGACPLQPKIFLISCSFGENLANSYVGAPWRRNPGLRLSMYLFFVIATYCLEKQNFKVHIMFFFLTSLDPLLSKRYLCVWHPLSRHGGKDTSRDTTMYHAPVFNVILNYDVCFKILNKTNTRQGCPEKRSVNVLRSQSLSSVLSCVQLATRPTEYGCNLPLNCATCRNTVLLTKQVCKTI